MLIHCKHCNSKFAINAEEVGFEGRLVKYKMSPVDDDGFKMGFEIKKIKKQPFKKSDFSIPTKWKKVD